MIIQLPFPPSVNTLYATVNNRRVLSKKGRLYKKEVGELVIAGGFKKNYDFPFKGSLSVSIKYYPANKRKFDIMNFNKALLDAFTEVGVYDDDSQIDMLIQKRCEVVAKPGHVVVRVVEI